MAFNKLQVYLSMKVTEKAAMFLFMGKLANRIKHVRKAAGLSQEKFAEALDTVEGIKVTRGAVGNWELGGGISRANLAAIADKFDVPLDWLEFGRGEIPKLQKPERSRKSSVENLHADTYTAVRGRGLVPASDLFGNVDLPVFGTAIGTSGAVVTKHAVDWTVRPPSLLRVEDGYGLIVPDDTMHPEHRAGSIALINPHLLPKVGEACALRCITENGTHLVAIREYRGETDTHWKVGQYNPPKATTLAKAAWTCQKIVGNYNA